MTAYTMKDSEQGRSIKMIEHINIIDALYLQVAALLDLMQSADSDLVDVESINVASEMCQTMLMNLMTEVRAIQEEWKEQK